SLTAYHWHNECSCAPAPTAGALASAVRLCPGTRTNTETSSKPMVIDKVSTARGGSAGYFRIYSRFIETATKIRPARAAAAPAVATKGRAIARAGTRSSRHAGGARHED